MGKPRQAGGPAHRGRDEECGPSVGPHAADQSGDFHKRHLCYGRGTPSLSATAPINPYAPSQVDESRKLRPSDLARKVTYNLVIMDGKKDYFADRQEIRPELRDARIAPGEARACQSMVPTKGRMGEYIPDYDLAH